MGLVEATRTCLKKYVDFTGRARRSEYWWFYLAGFLITAVLLVPAVILFFVGAASASGSDTSQVSAGGGVSFILAVILYGLAGLLSLALVLPNLAVGVRRLHDTDRSGWWLLIGLVPFGGIVLFVFHVLDSTPGPNRFGPSPKGVASYGGSTSSFDQGYGHPGQV